MERGSTTTPTFETQTTTPKSNKLVGPMKRKESIPQSNYLGRLFRVASCLFLSGVAATHRWLLRMGKRQHS